MPPRLSLQLLGGFQLRLESRTLALPSRKAQALLAYLAMRPGHPHGREAVTALLWGDVPDKQARQSLRQTLLRLRRLFAAARSRGFVVQGDDVMVDAAAIDVDVVEFEQRVREGTPKALAAAIALYRGPLLDGVHIAEESFEQWLLTERERLHETALDVLARLLAEQMKRGPAHAAVHTAARLLALDPLQESAHRALMRLYLRQGRRAAALRQYQVCVAVLQRELGVEPEPETKRLYREVLQKQSASPPGGRPVMTSTETPLVGRDDELARLRQRLAQAVRGSGGVVFLTGEAGIGKTRLIEELLVEAARHGARTLVGRAYETEQILPFRPWLDAFRAGGIVADVDLLAAVRPPWRTHLARLFPELAPAGAALTITSGDTVRLFEAIDGIVAQLARRQPLVVVVEDVHWADQASLHLLAFVGHRVSDRAALLVVTARDEELVDAPAARRLFLELEHARHLERVALPPLSEAGTTRLVHALARTGSRHGTVARLAQHAWAVSQGNPFVIVECVRGDLGDDATPDAGTALPQRVRELIAARLERLGPKARRIVEAAAVIQREFSFALLHASGGLDQGETAEAIEELVRRRVLDAVGDRFDFTHARVRSAVYDALLAPRRVALHATAGAALETLYADRLDQVYDRLAYHFSCADVPAKAFAYLVRLADNAARSYALEEAARALYRALEWVPRLGEDRDRRALDVLDRLAHVLLLLGRGVEVLDLLAKHERAIERLRDAALSGPYHFWLAYTHGNVADTDRAVPAARRALEEAARAGDEITMGRASYVLSRESYFAGRPLEGIAQGRQGVALLERTNERWWLGLMHGVLAVNLLHFGDFGPALEALERERDIGEALGDPRLQSHAAAYGGWVHTLCGDPERGIASAERAVAIALDPVGHLGALSMLGAIRREAGDGPRAVAVLEDALARHRAMGGRGGYRAQQFAGYYGAMLAEAYLLAGDDARARAAAETAIVIASDCRWLVAVGYAERAAGRIALAHGDAERARAHLLRAVDAFAKGQARYQIARTRLPLAEALHAAGDVTGAALEVNEAHEMFTRLQLPPYVERAERLARRLGVGLGLAHGGEPAPD